MINVLRRKSVIAVWINGYTKNTYAKFEMITVVVYGCLNQTLTELLVDISLEGINTSVKKNIYKSALHHVKVQFAFMILFVPS